MKTIKEEFSEEQFPKELIIQSDRYDWIGTKVELIKYKSRYVYYAICKGSSSKIFNIYALDFFEKLDKYTYFTKKELLEEYALKSMRDQITFVEERLSENSKSLGENT